jgi:hypothetical protein
VVFVVSIGIVYLLALAQNNINSINYNITTIQGAMASGNEDTVRDYCLGLPLTNFAAEENCSQYKGLFIKVILFSLFLPLLIAVLKFLFV